MARYCQEQKILRVFIFQQQILTLICRILRNSSSLYILYFYKELGFNLLVLKRTSISEKILATKGAVSHPFGRDPFHSFTTLKFTQSCKFPLFQTQVFQDLHQLTFFSTLILREWAALKMHHSLKNIRMSRYRNGAVFNFKLKFMKMNWGLSILYLSHLKKVIYITASILKLATAFTGCQLLIFLVSGCSCNSHLRASQGLWGSLAFFAKHTHWQMCPLCFRAPRFQSSKSQRKSLWFSVIDPFKSLTYFWKSPLDQVYLA